MNRLPVLLVLTFVGAACLPAAADVMRGDDPAAAADQLRHWQYAGEAEEAIAYLAPAAPGFVDRKSNATTRENTARIGNGTYGFEILEGNVDGNAGCALVLAAWNDSDDGEARVELFPFYMWRHEGVWKYLPNPTEYETWYQSVPDEMEPGYERLTTWLASARERHQQRLQQPAESLIAEWQQAHRDRAPSTQP